MSGVRCFVGLPLSKEFTARLDSVRTTIASSDPGWAGEKWVARENLHVTVAFLGDVPADSVEPLADAIGEALSCASAPKLRLTGISARPGMRHASMLWADLADEDDVLAGIARRIRRAASSHATPGSERAFRAHVTLVRARRPRTISAEAVARAAAAVASTETMSDPRVTLFASRLTSGGPVYTALREWAFE